MARTGFGITVNFATSGFACEIIDTTPPERSRESIDVTHTTTPNGDMEFIPSDIRDNGELELEIHFDESATPPMDADPEVITINFPSGTIWTFTGFMTNHGPAAPMDDRMTASVTVKVSGPITIT